MDKELITRLVRAVDGMPRYDIFFRDEATMMRFAYLVAEECAKVCEATPDGTWPRSHMPEECAEAIRAKFTT